MKILKSLYIKLQENNIYTKHIFKDLQNLVTAIIPLTTADTYPQLRLKTHFVPRREHNVPITQAKTRMLFPYMKYNNFFLQFTKKNRNKVCRQNVKLPSVKNGDTQSNHWTTVLTLKKKVIPILLIR